MPLFMTLLVRNEQDILESNLRFHLDRGVDHVIVTDNLSEDDTPGIITSFERQGLVTAISETSDDYSQSIWVSRMANMAHDMGANWIINNDADEFWWPQSGSLSKTLADVSCDVGHVGRDDYIPMTPEIGTFAERMIYRKTLSTNALGKPLPPKAAHRAVQNVIVAQGNHTATARALTTQDTLDTIRIHHFPLRSYGQFEQKIVLGGQAYERNQHLPKGMGNTWRHLYQEWTAGRLPEAYAADAMDQAGAETGVAEGDLVMDTRIRDALRDLT